MEWLMLIDAKCKFCMQDLHNHKQRVIESTVRLLDCWKSKRRGSALVVSQQFDAFMKVKGSPTTMDQNARINRHTFD